VKEFSFSDYAIDDNLSRHTWKTEDLQDILEWWRARKRVLQGDETHHETQRQTYHVEKRHIEAIKRAADLEGVSIMEIVNRAFKQFFRDAT
jgi:hypothetical protein